MFELTVAKFGGTSLANASQVRKVINIIRADPKRRVVVVSAPGKRHSKDTKITDLLLHTNDWLRTPLSKAAYAGELAKVSFRYRAMARALGVEFDSDELKNLYRLTGDALVSRGEYFMAKLLANALGFAFVDAAELIRFKDDGSVDWESTNERCTHLASMYEQGVVVGGFYGSMSDGFIRTFSRGGSDITGAILAAALGANLYENWTDVSGTLMADPRVVENPLPIALMTYEEMLELAYGGANVLHDEAIFPARKAGIPIRILNTNAPQDAGTLIVADLNAPRPQQGRVTGIAARKGISIVRIQKVGMSHDVGYGHAVLGILKDLRISWEHLPSRGESLSLVITDEELEGKLEKVVERITNECAPDKVLVRRGIGLIYVVGRGLAGVPGMLGQFATALGDDAINIVTVDQDDGELSMVFTIEAKDCDRAMRAAYRKFVVRQPPL